VSSEVGLRDFGSFDYVMIRHRPLSSEIKEFIAIEFQIGQTTGAGALVQAFKDFSRGGDISNQS